MKTKARRFDWYPGDYLSGTAGKLTLAEHGAYILVLNFIYESDGGAWPDDPGYLAWFTRGAEEEARRLLDSLVEKGKLRRVKRSKGPDLLTNARASAEVERTRHRIEAAKGKANKRWKSDGLDAAASDAAAYANAYAPALPGQCHGNASNQQPATSNQQPATSNQQPAISKAQPASPAAATPPVPEAAPRSPSSDRQFEDRVLEAAKIDPARWAGNFGMIPTWRNQGATDADILAGIEACAARSSYRPPASLRYFSAAIDEARRMRLEAQAAGRDPPRTEAARASTLEQRVAEYRIAKEAAKARGVMPGQRGFPPSSDFGIHWQTDRAAWVLIDGWKPAAGSGAAA